MTKTIRKGRGALLENEKNCVICGIFFIRRGKKKHTAKYCSRKCHGISCRGQPSKRKRTRYIEKKCIQCHKGFWSWEGENKILCSRSCYLPYRIGKRSGSKHWNWKGGISPINQVLRKSMSYKKWRGAIFKRDKYKCQECHQIGGSLCAHHIKAWADYPKLRFKINNGLTLCKKCHEKTDNFKRSRRIS